MDLQSETIAGRVPSAQFQINEEVETTLTDMPRPEDSYPADGSFCVREPLSDAREDPDEVLARCLQESEDQVGCEFLQQVVEDEMFAFRVQQMVADEAFASNLAQEERQT